MVRISIFVCIYGIKQRTYMSFAASARGEREITSRQVPRRNDLVAKPTYTVTGACVSIICILCARPSLFPPRGPAHTYTRDNIKRSVRFLMSVCREKLGEALLLPHANPGVK